MEKVITLRYAAKCKKCGLLIPAGERAVWLGKDSGSRHVSCNVETRQEIEKPKDDSGRDEFTIDYAELRNLWEDFIAQPEKVYRPENVPAARSLTGSWSADWSGSSIPEMREFLRSGYRVEGLDNVTSLIPSKPRRKLRYADEGDEMLLDMAFGGADEPFIEWEKRASKPGLSVEIYMTFSASFPAKTIVAYQRWIARALQTLDENGVDMEVSLVSPLNGLASDDYSWKSLTKIRVRKAGEASDFSNWSAMFSPGGFRQLVIMSTGIHADRAGKRVSYGYGSPQAYGKWEVAYDEERNRIVIGNSNSDTEFPEFTMTEKLQSVLAALNG